MLNSKWIYNKNFQKLVVLFCTIKKLRRKADLTKMNNKKRKV